MMSERDKLLKTIQRCDFVLYELQLYLDTHPNCQQALSAYRKHREIKKKAEDIYISKYGPIIPQQSNAQEKWDWVENPWPWERSEN